MDDDRQPVGDLHFTANRMIRQIDSLMPQIHLTLVSIQQGIALVFLLTSVQPPKSPMWSDILAALKTNHLFLPHIASLLLIILVWNQFAHATIFLYWPVSNATASLLFLFCVAEIIAFSSARYVGAWMLWTGMLLFVATFVRRRNRSVISKVLFRRSPSYQRRVWSPFAALDILAIGAISLSCGICREYGLFHFAGTVAVMGSREILFDYLAPLLLVVVIGVAMRQDDHVFYQATNEFLRGSPYRVGRKGRVELADGDSRRHETN